MQQPTKEFLGFLSKNPGLRKQIAAPHDKTLVYAGKFFLRDSWKELEHMQARDRDKHDFVLVPTILKGMHPPQGTVIGTQSMYEHLLMLDNLVPWQANGFIAWRAVSGIYASNASGKVRFYVGSGIRRATGPLGEAPKVLAATEVWVLIRNRNIDEASRDMVEYLARCVCTKQVDIQGHSVLP